MKTDTAHLTWNGRWATPDGRAAWLKPHEDVLEVSEGLLTEGKTFRVLDLGCGVGRHALHFARMGFETHAIDMAESGVAQVRQSAAEMGLNVGIQAAPMTELPFPDAHFDYVLAFNVIYHGDGSIVRQAISEIARVLKPGGLYQGTMLSKRGVTYGVGTEVAPDTFVNDDDDEKDHPHFYCSAAELVALFKGFELRTLVDKEHSTPGSWHWHMTAEKLA